MGKYRARTHFKMADKKLTKRKRKNQRRRRVIKPKRRRKKKRRKKLRHLLGPKEIRMEKMGKTQKMEKMLRRSKRRLRLIWNPTRIKYSLIMRKRHMYGYMTL